eukprot:3633189-Pyramimonas_sp.AAC.1
MQMGRPRGPDQLRGPAIAPLRRRAQRIPHSGQRNVGRRSGHTTANTTATFSSATGHDDTITAQGNSAGT